MNYGTMYYGTIRPNSITKQHNRHLYFSTYKDTCTLLDTMLEEDWAGIAAELGDQVRAMLADAGMDLTQCPSPAQDINLDATITLPAMPPLLSVLNLANVSTE